MIDVLVVQNTEIVFIDQFYDTLEIRKSKKANPVLIIVTAPWQMVRYYCETKPVNITADEER